MYVRVRIWGQGVKNVSFSENFAHVLNGWPLFKWRYWRMSSAHLNTHDNPRTSLVKNMKLLSGSWLILTLKIYYHEFFSLTSEIWEAISWFDWCCKLLAFHDWKVERISRSRRYLWSPANWPLKSFRMCTLWVDYRQAPCLWSTHAFVKVN